MRKRFKRTMIAILQSLITGVLVGMMIGLYQRLVHFIVDKSQLIYQTRTISNMITMMFIAIVLGIVSQVLVKKFPDISGSGIPQLELYIRGKRKIKWYQVVPLMLMNSCISFFTGLSLGSEGPSVEIGGCMAMVANQLCHKEDDKQMIAVGGGSGFGCAFLSPIAGVVYTFEESLHHFDYRLVFKTIIAVISSFFIANLINQHKLLEFDIQNKLLWKDYYLIAIIIVVSLFIGVIFTKTTIIVKNAFKKLSKKTESIIVVLLFMISVLFAFFIYDYSGSGSKIISTILTERSLAILGILIVFKMLFTNFSAASKASGGLLIPMLSIGAIMGMLICLIFHNLTNFNEMYYDSIIILCMLGVFAVVTKSPFTAFALCISLVKPSNIIIPAILAFGILAIFMKILKTEDIYEKLIKCL